MRHRRIAGSLAIACLGLCGFVLAGCGSGQPVAQAKASRSPGTGVPELGSGTLPSDRSLAGMHACRLVPASVAVQTVGQLDRPPQESPDGLGCAYSTAGYSVNYTVAITPRSFYEGRKDGDRAYVAAHQGQMHDVSGMGDDAFVFTSSLEGPDYVLSVAKGGVAVAVEVNSQNGADERRANQLAAAALARL